MKLFPEFRSRGESPAHPYFIRGMDTDDGPFQEGLEGR
jgi:hypothetical protein